MLLLFKPSYTSDGIPPPTPTTPTGPWIITNHEDHERKKKRAKRLAEKQEDRRKYLIEKRAARKEGRLEQFEAEYKIRKAEILSQRLALNPKYVERQAKRAENALIVAQATLEAERLALVAVQIELKKKRDKEDEEFLMLQFIMDEI